MKREEMAALIDHTILKPAATADQVLEAAWLAFQSGCASVCVNSSRVRLLADRGPDDMLTVCSVVGFPLGAVPRSIKAAEARQAQDDWATEFDMVIDIGLLKDGDRTGVERDIAAVRSATEGRVLKVILETAALTDAEIVTGCLISRDAGADFVKTSTGFHAAGGATPSAVALMAKTVPDLGVKASGGITDLPRALAMLEAGATRLGCSATETILDSLD
jgi:deoxyribose-phosphate aldolase